MESVKQPPYSKEAEMAVLGAIFLNDASYGDVARIISAEDFYFEIHQELFTVFGLCETEAQIDLPSINLQLQKRGTLEKIGGIKRVVDIVQFVQFSMQMVDAQACADVIAEYAKRRRGFKFAMRTAEALCDTGVEFRTVLDKVQAALMSAVKPSARIQNVHDAGGAFLEELDRRKKSGQRLPGISTGFSKLDVMTGGFEPGKLYIIGGRPSMGKTALALNMTSKMALAGHTVMYFSLEMRTYEVMKRLISSQTRIKAARLKAANFTEKDYDRIAKEVVRFHPQSLFIDDNGYQTMQSITSACISMNTHLQKHNNRIQCVVIDHLHLLASEKKSIDRRTQIGEISRAAKLLADTLSCPVILLSQLSRAGRERSGNRPILSDLRESGDIEQDADVVMFVHREEYYDPTEENHGKAELILAKNRDGACGTLPLGWDKSITTFFPWE